MPRPVLNLSLILCHDSVSGSEDGKTFFWDVQTKEVAQVLEGHEGIV